MTKTKLLSGAGILTAAFLLVTQGAGAAERYAPPLERTPITEGTAYTFSSPAMQALPSVSAVSPASSEASPFTQVASSKERSDRTVSNENRENSKKNKKERRKQRDED